jgi:hypothetical protein
MSLAYGVQLRCCCRPQASRCQQCALHDDCSVFLLFNRSPVQRLVFCAGILVLIANELGPTPPHGARGRLLNVHSRFVL